MEETAGLLKTNPSALMAFDRIESKAGGALPCNELGIERPDSQALRQEAPDLTELQQTAADAAQKAKECGVDIAKRGFFSKLLTLVAASAVLVAAALVTGFTGGAGIPLLALAGVGFAMAVGDVACAACDWYSKAHGGEGLAMGGDSLGNLLHKISSKCGASTETAKKIATYGSILTRGALAVSTAAVGGFAAVATPTALHSAVASITVCRTALDVANGTLTGNSTLLGGKKQTHEKEAAEARAQKGVAEPLLHQLGTKRDQLGAKDAQLVHVQSEKHALEQALDKTTHTLAAREQQLATQADESSRMRAGMESMQGQLKDMDAQLGALSHQLGATTQQSQAQEKMISAQDQYIQQLKSRVEKMTSMLTQKAAETTPLLPAGATRSRSQSVPLFV